METATIREARIDKLETVSIREAGIDKLFNVINYTFVTVILILVLYPLIFVVSSSLSSNQAVTSGKVWLWPVDFSLEGYKAIFQQPLVVHSFLLSVGYTVVGTVLNVVLTITAAYPLSRKDLSGRGVIMALFAFTIFFNGGLIPNYLLVKNLGMLNTPWALWLPAALNIWNMIIARTYFQTTIPGELLEAAQMDGCSDFKFLWKVVIPLSGPIVAVVALFNAVDFWNQYFNAMIYLNSPNLYPFQLVLREILVESQMSVNAAQDADQMAAMAGLADLLKYALIVVGTVPLLIVYPFVQRHFVKGIMVGSLKG